MGTGIVFVVLVAIWVAYFVQYWSRRREHLATARSVEAFSEAMRVLERRPPLRAAARDRISSAYSVSPARIVGARPQVMAKPRPAPSPGGAPGMRTLASSHASPARSTPSSARREGPARRLGAGRTELTPSRKVRGLVLLGVLFVTLVTAVLAPLTRMLWWVPLVGLTGVVAAFFWLRAAVQAEVRARRSARRPAPRHRTAASSRPARVTEGRDVADLAAGREAELVDGRTVTVVESSSAEGDGEGWSPVPVPPPTYTLKARAEYRPSGFEEPMGAEAQAANADTNADTDASADVAPGAGESADEGRAAYGT